MLRFLIFLSSSEEKPKVSNEVVISFLPSPQDLIEIDRNALFHMLHFYSAVALRARWVVSTPAADLANPN